MTFEKGFELWLPEPPHHLLQPEKVFSNRSPFGALHRQERLLSGRLETELPLLGDVQFPFESRLEAVGEQGAHLYALPLEPAPQFWAEIGGEGQLEAGGIRYRLRLRLHAHLPEGEKWGGKALRRMAEAAFERAVGRALEQLSQASGQV